jgi:Na+-transporting methylmalonyl-CoA/oxaloacetate decarboxylase beta subunit
MSIYTKRILFALAGLIILGLIGVWSPEAQRLLGCFAMGWMLMDIAIDIFPEVK